MRKCTFIGCNVKHKTRWYGWCKHKTCQFKDCDKQTAFNYKGDKQAIYCAKHKQGGMVDIKLKHVNLNIVIHGHGIIIMQKNCYVLC